MEMRSKNNVSIDQLSLACRHVGELMVAGVSENLAIRTLELFADVHAKLRMGGSATPHHVDQVELWSLEALRARHGAPTARAGDFLRVEHGTPRRAFARMVLELYRKNDLNEATMGSLVQRYWKLAVITADEDRRLNRLVRSKQFDRPEDRWAAAEIEFPRINSIATEN